MRFVLVLFLLGVLTACSPAPSTQIALDPPSQNADPASGSDTDAVDDVDDELRGYDVQGPFEEASAVAAARTGAMAFSSADISFTSGRRLATTSLATFSVNDPMNAKAQTFNSADAGEDDRVVDVRRIDRDSAAANAEPLCNSGATATFVALVHEQPVQAVSIIVFSGADIPGTGAVNSQVCAVYAYQAPDQIL